MKKRTRKSKSKRPRATSRKKAAPPKRMCRFTTRFVVKMELDIAEDLIVEVLKQDWKEMYYRFTSPQEAADHIAYNFARNHARLNQLDGFAHREESDAVVVSENWEDDWD